MTKKTDKDFNAENLGDEKNGTFIDEKNDIQKDTENDNSKDVISNNNIKSNDTKTNNIIIMNADDIFIYDRNPRKITNTAINKVAESIKEFGFLNPIIIDKNTLFRKWY